YGDGSYSCDLLVGAWAAHVPSFVLQIVGSGPGPSAGHFEFCSMVEGMRGATTGVAAGDPVAAFQSTRPTRAASRYYLGYCDEMTFQSTRPTRGATSTDPLFPAITSHTVRVAPL